MVHRVIGQEHLRFAPDGKSAGALGQLDDLLDWGPIAERLGRLHASSKGEAAWPPLAMFKALLLSVWYDLSDVKLAEALDDRASFRRFCGFSSREPTPERTAFVRFRQALVKAELDRVLFEAITAQLKARAVTVKTGTIVDATIIASASEADADARWVKHKKKPAVHGFKAHVGADAVHAKGGRPRIAATAMWGRDEEETLARLAAFNSAIQRVHARIEKIFGTWKRSYGLRRMRWRGLAKATAQVRLTAIAYNLKRGLSITPKTA